MVTGRPHTYFIQIREQDGTSVLSTLCNDPLLNVYARQHTQEVANPENLNCNFVLYTFLAITLFALFFPSLFLCAVSNIFPIIFSLLSFFLFFLLLDFLFSFFLPSCFSLFLLFPGHVLTSRSDPFISGIFARTAKAAFLIVVSWNAK